MTTGTFDFRIPVTVAECDVIIENAMLLEDEEQRERVLGDLLPLRRALLKDAKLIAPQE